MQMHVRPLSEESDVLDHRRHRLQEILSMGLVSAELREKLLQNLAEVEYRLEHLHGAPAPAIRRAA